MQYGDLQSHTDGNNSPKSPADSRPDCRANDGAAADFRGRCSVSRPQGRPNPVTGRQYTYCKPGYQQGMWQHVPEQKACQNRIDQIDAGNGCDGLGHQQKLTETDFTSHLGIICRNPRPKKVQNPVQSNNSRIEGDIVTTKYVY